MKYTDQEIHNEIKNLYCENEKHLSSHMMWIKNIILISSSIFGVLIALSDLSNEPYKIRVTFIISIILLSLNIIFGGIIMYFEIFFHKLLYQNTQERVNYILIYKEYAGTTDVAPTRLFIVLECVCYLLLFLSIISLVYYTLLKNIPELFL